MGTDVAYYGGISDTTHHTMPSGLRFLIAAKRCEIAELQQLALTSELVNALGGLVHGLQRERGLSNLCLGSRGTRWTVEREAQMLANDGLAHEVRSLFAGMDTAAEPIRRHGARLYSRIAYVLQGLDALPQLRHQVTTQAWNHTRATAAYIRLVRGLLAVVFEAADSATDPDISRRLVARFNFMQGKEFAGQERATGAALFAGGRADASGQQQLLHLIESQERCFQVFAEFADGALLQAWQTAQSAKNLASHERMRRVLCTAAQGAPLDEELSQCWFDTCTEAIDAMKTVEDLLSAGLVALCQQRVAATAGDLQTYERLQENAAQAPRSPAHSTLGFFDETKDERSHSMALDQASPGFGQELDRSILELVQEQAQRLQSMSDELDTVRASLNERKLIERAKGLLMAHRRLSEEEAHKTLRQMAMGQNRRVVDVAEAVLSMADLLPEPKH